MTIWRVRGVPVNWVNNSRCVGSTFLPSSTTFQYHYCLNWKCSIHSSDPGHLEFECLKCLSLEHPHLSCFSISITTPSSHDWLVWFSSGHPVSIKKSLLSIVSSLSKRNIFLLYQAAFYWCVWQKQTDNFVYLHVNSSPSCSVFLLTSFLPPWQLIKSHFFSKCSIISYTKKVF